MSRKAVTYSHHINKLFKGFYLQSATLVLLLLQVLTATAQANNAPVEVLIPHRPTAVKGSDNRFHLAYELHITNFYQSSGPLTLKSLSVFGDKFTLPIATFSKAGLLTLLNAQEVPDKGKDVIIAAGRRKILFVWLTLPSGAVPPQSLHHKITFTDKKKAQYQVTGAVTPVDQKKLWVFGPPVRGHSWFIGEGPGNPKSHHWGSLLAQNGTVTIPQRYAIDFFGLNDAGHAVETQPGKLNQTANKQWTGFGSEVLAVHDAVVRDMRDSIADHAPLAPLPEPKEITARGVYGNFIVLEIAPGVFVHYAHLQHGSVKVHIGQHVKLGDVIARLGDSGNAGAAHLHFHVSDKPTFEFSEGMPFVFSTIGLLGKSNEANMLDPTSKFKAQTVKQNNVLPLFGDVVRFDF